MNDKENNVKFKRNTPAINFLGAAWVITAVIVFAYILPRAQNERAQRETYVPRAQGWRKELELETRKWENQTGVIFEASLSASPTLKEISQKRDQILAKITREENSVDYWDKKLQKTSSIGFILTSTLILLSLLLILLVKNHQSRKD